MRSQAFEAAYSTETAQIKAAVTWSTENDQPPPYWTRPEAP